MLLIHLTLNLLNFCLLAVKNAPPPQENLLTIIISCSAEEWGGNWKLSISTWSTAICWWSASTITLEEDAEDRVGTAVGVPGNNGVGFGVGKYDSCDVDDDNLSSASGANAAVSIVATRSPLTLLLVGVIALLHSEDCNSQSIKDMASDLPRVLKESVRLPLWQNYFNCYFWGATALTRSEYDCEGRTRRETKPGREEKKGIILLLMHTIESLVLAVGRHHLLQRRRIELVGDNRRTELPFQQDQTQLAVGHLLVHRHQIYELLAFEWVSE